MKLVLAIAAGLLRDRTVLLRRHLTIPRLLVLSFALVIVAGTLVLKTPWSMAPGAESLRLVDALFMSTSAVCVTGLATRDLALEFSPAGQVVILLLIQAGGLGILSFSSLLLHVRRSRATLATRELIGETHGSLPYLSPVSLLKQVFRFAFAVEIIGAALLTLRFWSDFPLGQALWLGVFHSVSAFCNAGFALFSDSFVGYQDDPVINVVLMAEIILGGLGFLVVADFADWVRAGARYAPRKLSLHSRVVLWATLFLISGGAAILLFLEFFNSASGVQSESLIGNLLQKIQRMTFLSVTSRTAGFNTIVVSELTNMSLLIVIILMMIGGAPGSTAGGLKITTAATLYAILRSRALLRPTPEILDRSIPPATIGKALANLAGFFMTAIIAVFLLEWSENPGMPHIHLRGRFLEHVFEVVSALCTVGLSTGLTPTLSTTGKLIIVACMFLGRLGPVMVGTSLYGERRPVSYQLPEETLVIG